MKTLIPIHHRLANWLSTSRQLAAALGLGLLLPTGAHAATSTWVGATDGNWGIAANWDVAFVNGYDVILTGSANTSPFLGAPRTVNSITFPNTATAAFKIQLSAAQNNGGATKALTFGSGNTGITIDSGDTVSHQITGPTGGATSYITLLGDLTVTHNGTFPFTITRPISGNFGLIKAGSGTLIYSGPIGYGSSVPYAGNTTITAGTLMIGAANVIPDGAGKGNVIVNGTFDLNAKTETVNGLSGGGVVDTVAGSAALTVGANDQSSTFSGVIQSTGGTLDLAKTGTGTLTLSGTNTYVGTTTINNGKLVGVTGGSASNSPVTINAASAISSVSITDNSKHWTYASLNVATAGTLEFSFGSIAPSTSVAPLQILGSADFTVTPTVTVVGANLSVGTFPLMTWSSTSGTAPTAVTLPAGVTGSLNVSGTTLRLVISSVEISINKANNADNLNLGSSWVGGVAPTASQTAQWNGTVTADNTTVVGSDKTWKAIKIVNPAGLVTIDAGNTLTLGAGSTDIDMSAATTNLTLNCALALGAANVWDVASGQMLTLGGVVSGSSTITKQGLGSATLAGANTFSGGLTLNAGTLNLNSADALGATASTFTITGGAIDNSSGGALSLANNNPQAWNGDFTFTGTQDLDLGTGAVTPSDNRTVTVNAKNLTVGGTIGGGGISLTKAGVGTLTLAAANTFSGGLNLNNGTLNLNHPGALGDSVSTFNVAGGSIDNTSVGPITLTNNNPIGLNANLNFVGTQDLDLGTSAVALSFARTITANGGGTRNLAIGGVISGGFNLTKAGTGALVLNGLNDFSGQVIIAGPLKANTIANTGVPSSLGAGYLIRIGDVSTTGSLEYTGTNAASTDRPIQIGVSGNGGGGAIILNNNVEPTNTLTFSNGSFNQAGIGNYAAARTLTLGGANSGNNEIQGSIIDNAFTVTPTISLTKTGTGTWVLSGANTYTGTTTVNGGGTLLVNNSLASPAVAVNNGTLGGIGTLAGVVTVAAGGTIRPGLDSSSIATLTITSNLTLNGTALMVINRTNAQTASLITGLTNLTLSGTLTVANAGPAVVLNDTFTLFSALSTAGNFSVLNLPDISPLAWSFNPAAGTLTAVNGTASNPTNISYTISDSTLTLTWPQDHLGWYAQSNSVNLADANYWFDVAGSQSATNLIITISPAQPNVFFRLRKP